MIGRTLAHYEVVDLLGKGGMGEVYRANDTKLGRQVALKLLPPELAGDTERLARFRREARTLASLHHPRIASLFGIEEIDGMTILVMELVEGHDLAERLEQGGALPVDDVVAIAIQLAEGLEFAHDNNVMHRDLKPANIKLTPGGEIKVLDFGLARAFTGDSIDESDILNSPTITAGLTQMGVILGTAAYMSPEQAKGKSVDRRADIWSYGVILFELLTGERLFHGETASETMADVMKSEIDWERLPKKTPTNVRRILERCLDRDPVTRLRDIGEARVALSQPEGAQFAGADDTGTSSSLVPWIVAALAITTAAAAIVWGLSRSPETTAPTVRTQADLVAGPDLGYDTGGVHLELSPDGDRLAFAGLDGDGNRWIYVRNLGTGELRRLDGTEDGEIPFWSPDGTRLGFFVAGALSIIGVEDGIIEREIVRLNSWAMDATWHTDGWIVLLDNDNGANIHRVEETGGETQLIYSVEEFDSAFSHADVLPGGAIMFSADYFDGSDLTGIYVFENGEARQILKHASNAQWVESQGAIVFRREQRIFAQRFNLATRNLQGDPVRIGGPVRTKTFPSQAFMTVGGDGTLLYLEGEAGASDSELVWVDRQGKLVDRLNYVGDLYSMDVSHDGRRVAFDNSEPETGGDIWVYDFGRRSSVRFTDHPIDESAPLWSRDDKSIYFFRGVDLLRVDVVGTPAIVELISDGTARRPQDIHPQTGQLLLRGQPDGGRGRELRLLDLDTLEEQVWLDLAGTQNYACFSPDGRWVAYHSDHEDGQHVWIESFPDRRERFRVSDDGGGAHPEWRADGLELYYVSPSRKMMAVAIDMDATDRSPIGTPEVLFPVRLRRNLYYDVGPEPNRFLLNQLTGEAAAKSAVLVRGWQLDSE